MTRSPKYYDYNEAMRSFEVKQANILHLIDLKRAGHSPTRTEFGWRPDRRVKLLPAYREAVDA